MQNDQQQNCQQQNNQTPYYYNPEAKQPYYPPYPPANSNQNKPEKSKQIIYIILAIIVTLMIAFTILFVRPGFFQLDSKASVITKAKDSYQDCSYLYSKRSLEGGWANRYDYFESNGIEFYVRTQAYLYEDKEWPIPIRLIESRSHSNYAEQVLMKEKENIYALVPDEIEIQIRPYEYNNFQYIQIIMDDVSDAQLCCDFIENSQTILGKYQPIPYSSSNGFSGFESYYYFEPDLYYVITLADGTPIMSAYASSDAIGDAIHYYTGDNANEFKEILTERFESGAVDHSYYYWD